MKGQGRVERDGLGEKVRVGQWGADRGLDEVRIRLDHREVDGGQWSRSIGGSDLGREVGRDGSGELAQLWLIGRRHVGGWWLVIVERVLSGILVYLEEAEREKPML